MRLEIPRAALSSAVAVKIESWKEAHCEHFLNSLGGRITPTGGRSASDCVAVYPEGEVTASNMPFKVKMELTHSPTASKTKVC